MTTTDPADLWVAFRATTRPIHALLRHVHASPDPDAEYRRLVEALAPGELAALLPEIRRERERGEVWLAEHGGDDA
jgi:hypothetical protein